MTIKWFFGAIVLQFYIVARSVRCVKMLEILCLVISAFLHVMSIPVKRTDLILEVLADLITLIGLIHLSSDI